MMPTYKIVNEMRSKIKERIVFLRQRGIPGACAAWRIHGKLFEANCLMDQLQHNGVGSGPAVEAAYRNCLSEADDIIARLDARYGDAFPGADRGQHVPA